MPTSHNAEENPVVDQKAPERTTPALRERLARRKPIEKLVAETDGPEAHRGGTSASGTCP